MPIAVMAAVRAIDVEQEECPSINEVLAGGIVAGSRWPFVCTYYYACHAL